MRIHSYLTEKTQQITEKVPVVEQNRRGFVNFGGETEN